MVPHTGVVPTRRQVCPGEQEEGGQGEGGEQVPRGEPPVPGGHLHTGWRRTMEQEEVEEQMPGHRPPAGGAGSGPWLSGLGVCGLGVSGLGVSGSWVGGVVAWVVVGGVVGGVEGGGVEQPSAGSPPEGQVHSSPLSVTSQAAPAAQGPGEHSAIEIPSRPSGTRSRKAEVAGRREWRRREVVGRRSMAAWLPGRIWEKSVYGSGDRAGSGCRGQHSLPGPSYMYTSDGRDQDLEVETETETFILGLMGSRLRPRLLF